MRLLVVSHACANRQNQQIYAEIERITGWELTLIVPQAWRDEFGRSLDEAPWPELRGQVIKLPVLFNGNIILHCYRAFIGRLLAQGRFDRIYVNHEPYALATAQVAAANRGTKCPIGFYSCQNLLKTYPPPFSWLERFVYQQCAFALPITEKVAAVLRTKGFRGELTVCPLPFDPARYRPRAAGEWPAALWREPGVPLIGYVGRLVEAKGLRTLMRALALLTDLSWKLAIIGSGPLDKELRALIQDQLLSARCLHFGFVPHEETPAYLSALDIVVVPSESQPGWEEQFGRIIPEALASGAVVVGSDSGEIPNLLRASGGGRVFPQGDAVALAGELRALLLNAGARAAHAEVGRAWALQHMSIQPVALRMAQAIEGAVTKQSSLNE